MIIESPSWCLNFNIYNNIELWIEIMCLMKLFRWAFFFIIWPQHYDIFLHLVEMPKIPNILHLQVQITSGALRVSKFWSKERRLFAWQIKPKILYLARDCLQRTQRGKRFAMILETPWKQDLLRYVIFIWGAEQNSNGSLMS